MEESSWTSRSPPESSWPSGRRRCRWPEAADQNGHRWDATSTAASRGPAATGKLRCLGAAKRDGCYMQILIVGELMCLKCNVFFLYRMLFHAISTSMMTVSVLIETHLTKIWGFRDQNRFALFLGKICLIGTPRWLAQLENSSRNI